MSGSRLFRPPALLEVRDLFKASFFIITITYALFACKKRGHNDDVGGTVASYSRSLEVRSQITIELQKLVEKVDKNNGNNEKIQEVEKSIEKLWDYIQKNGCENNSNRFNESNIRTEPYHDIMELHFLSLLYITLPDVDRNAVWKLIDDIANNKAVKLPGKKEPAKLPACYAGDAKDLKLPNLEELDSYFAEFKSVKYDLTKLNGQSGNRYGFEGTVVSPVIPPKPHVTLNSCKDFFNKNDTILKFSMPKEGEGIFKINKSTKPLKATYYFRNKHNEKDDIKTLDVDFHDKTNVWVFVDQLQGMYLVSSCSQSKMSGKFESSTGTKFEFEINNEKKTTKCSNFFKAKYSPIFNRSSFFRYTINSDEKYYKILRINDTNSDSVYNADINFDDSSTPLTITLNDDKITFKDKSGKNETWEGTCYENVILGLKNNQDFAISITNVW